MFKIVNVLPLPIWGLWVLAPRTRPSRYLARALWPWAVLGALYAGLLGYALASGGTEGGSFSSLSGVMALFDSPWGTLAGWVHFLAFDLFAARWIMNDAPDAGYKLAPILLATLMAGPLGLLIYLMLRRWLRGANDER